ncbi:MAG: bifunctional phosphopantothenoylcysteine decarboxylase/phosphopantothenate--cysteine ligase CoaBC [Candidatus Hydrogenedentales bacterium]
MTSFSNKSILLGVTGSIAAYKACDLASRLREKGANVICALTASACELVKPVSFEALTGNRAITEMFVPTGNQEISHIAIMQRVDLCLIAPATANIIAKAATGIGDDWLSTALLAARCPVLFAPAMNTHMYTHAATQDNIALLKKRGISFVGPASGRLACRDEGPGRFAEISDILDACQIALCTSKDLEGKRVLITSGANHEAIDPMRYLGNRSSGKMGRALALEALCRGASVTVVMGPSLVSPPSGAETVAVETAQEMHDAVMARAEKYDFIIGAAAVADYRPETVQAQKLKRDDKEWSLRLIPNPDIIAAVASKKKPSQRVVGFAAETDHMAESASEKLTNKDLDMIIANQIGGPSCAIGADTENAVILMKGCQPESFEEISKDHLAKVIFDRLMTIN